MIVKRDPETKNTTAKTLLAIVYWLGARETHVPTPELDSWMDIILYISFVVESWAQSLLDRYATQLSSDKIAFAPVK